MTIKAPSKSTIEGVLSVLTTIGLVLLASNSPLIGKKADEWITLILAVSRGLTGLLTKDAETVTSADVTKANIAANFAAGAKQ